MNRCTIGLDFGTSGAKVCILDDALNVLGLESEPYPTSVPHPLWAEQNAADWLPAAASALQRALGKLGWDYVDECAIAVSSAAHIGVLIDANDEPIRPAILWSDQRSEREALALGKAHGEEILGLGKNWPSATWTLPHLKWIQKNAPRDWERTKYVMLSKDYVAFQLTGEKLSDPAAAVSALLFDPALNDWSPRLCELGGIDVRMLPPVAKVGSKVGTIRESVARRLKVPSKSLVFNGTLDSISETLAAGVHDDTSCVIRLASAGGMHVISNTPRPAQKLISYPFIIEPFWLTQAGTNTCATAVSWARDLFSRRLEGLDFEDWSDLAGLAPAGVEGLLFHPYLAGERCPYWSANLRASFTGLSLNHEMKHIARAVYEGTAYSLIDAASAIPAEARQFDCLRLVGGGTRSKTWNEIVCAVFNTPGCVIPAADSSLGAALVALAGLTGAKIDELASSRVGVLDIREPEPDLVDIYRQGYLRYTRTQKLLEASYER